MSDSKKKRGRPKTTPAVSYEAEIRMRSNKGRRNIKKPKYLLDVDNESNNSRSSTPSRNPRGYNTDVNDQNSEFHYGSDFDTEDNSDNERANSPLSDYSSDDEGVLSDDDTNIFDNKSFSIQQNDIPAPMNSFIRPVTPVAIWLQDKKIPTLTLPPSANDLLIPVEFLMPALTVYEVLKQNTQILRLSPFR